MVEQFPRDESGPVVYLWAATLNPNECAEFAKRVEQAMRHDAAGLPGFLEGRIFEADDGSSVICTTNWETRHAWAAAQWNKEIGRVVAESFHSAIKIVDTMCYQRAVVKPHSA
jgi:heme-degrading monooxygenase HmoA